jgi:hypothetical protein
MMDDQELLSTQEIEPKHSTQIISIIVGVLLTVVGMAGILFSGFAGLHLSAPYSTIIVVSGVLLLYNGYNNNSRDAFVCCLVFTIFYGLHAIAGWVFGRPGVPNVGFGLPDPKWLQIIPHFHELGRNDHILNTILCLVLFGGTIDWWRRHTQKGNRKEGFREFKRYREQHRHHSRTDQPIRQ